MSAFKHFAGAMRVRTSPYSSRGYSRGNCGPECLCDNCCRERAEKNKGWADTPHAKEMHQIMTTRRR